MAENIKFTPLFTKISTLKANDRDLTLEIRVNRIEAETCFYIRLNIS
jgi:hypothetical protein